MVIKKSFNFLKLFLFLVLKTHFSPPLKGQDEFLPNIFLYGDPQDGQNYRY